MRTLIACLTILAVAATASATITITAGSQTVFENSPGQVFQILISTDSVDTISGANLAIQIGATGQTCPDITAFDTDSAGYIFNGGGGGSYTDGTGPGYPGISIGDVTGPPDPNNDPVASGALMLVTIDTTGYFVADGPYVIKLMTGFGNTEALDTNGSPISGTVYTDGTLSLVVPEPATLALLGLGSLGALIRRRRR